MGRKESKKRKQKPPTNKPSPEHQAQGPLLPVRHPWWKRTSVKLVSTLGLFGGLVALFQFYPWLSIHQSAMLDPLNPYSQLFTVSNGGYIPVTDLDAECVANAIFPFVGRMKELSATFPHFADYLAHDEEVTAPCFQTLVGTQRPSAGSTLDITITYSLYHIRIKALRKSQTFKFRSVVSVDKSQHWIFVK